MVGLLLTWEACRQGEREELGRALTALEEAAQGCSLDLLAMQVETVAVKCASDEVELGCLIHDNRHYNKLDSVQRFSHKKSSMKNLTAEEKTIRKQMSWTIRHMDKRSHQIVLRKCMKSLGESVCSWCKKNPPKLSGKFIAALPPRSTGGLWFTPSPDPERPGHFLTFLQQQDLLKKQQLTMIPDGDLDVLRCQVFHKKPYNVVKLGGREATVA